MWLIAISEKVTFSEVFLRNSYHLDVAFSGPDKRQLLWRRQNILEPVSAETD